MPTSIRGFSYHLSFVAARLVTTLMIGATHFLYEIDPKFLVGIIQGLVALAMIVQFFFRDREENLVIAYHAVETGM